LLLVVMLTGQTDIKKLTVIICNVAKEPTILNKVVYSVYTKRKYIINNKHIWLHFSVLPNYLQASIYYMGVYLVCTSLWCPIVLT